MRAVLPCERQAGNIELVNQSISNQSIKQSTNQCIFLVLGTHQRCQQTTGNNQGNLTMLDLNETCHSMLVWAAQRPKYGSTKMFLHVLLQCDAMLELSSPLRSGLVVDDVLYMAYPDGCQHTFTLLPRLRPHSGRGPRVEKKGWSSLHDVVEHQALQHCSSQMHDRAAQQTPPLGFTLVLCHKA